MIWASPLTGKDEFVLQQAEMRKHPRPPGRDISALQNWHWNHQYRAIDREEQSYLDYTQDQWPWAKLPPELPRVEQQAEDYTRDITLEARIKTIINVLMVVVGMAMLIAPMSILEFLQNPLSQLGTITAFILGFFGTGCIATIAEPFQLFAATAA